MKKPPIIAAGLIRQPPSERRGPARFASFLQRMKMTEVPKMTIPLKITFPDFPHSDAIADRIRKRLAKLESICSWLISCEVNVGYTNHKHHRGNLYFVSVDLSLPGEEIVSGKGGNYQAEHKDVYVALRDAFDIAERQLIRNMERRRVRQRVHRHEAPPHGRVLRIVLENSAGEGYGFLQSPDGREIYFNSHSVLNDAFTELKVGSEVRFAEEMGNEGPQASTVELIAA